jgi:uncharacterized protein (DUF488 family)
MTEPLLTFGHGTAGRERLTALLHGAGVAAVVDVRTAPGSRRNADVNRALLQDWMPEQGIAYRWEKRLGGFRRPAPDSPDVFWENVSFRGYAGHARSADFLTAIDDLLRRTATMRTAVMCGETLWWRCHRRIIADFVVVARRVPVLHLAHDGRLSEHRPTAGARLREDGLIVYDHDPRRPGR